MYQTFAKFNSTCAASGCRIKKGDRMHYDSTTKKCYHIDHKPNESNDPDFGLAQTIQANEEAYFDNFCRANNI